MTTMPQSGESSTRKQELGEHLRNDANMTSESKLRTKWLSFTIFVLWLGFAINLFNASLFLTTHTASLTIYSVSLTTHPVNARTAALLLAMGMLLATVAYGLQKRRLWAWRLNWVIIGLRWIYISVRLAHAGKTSLFNEPNFIAGYLLFLLFLLGIVWVWPNYVYFRKRRILFQPAKPVRRFKDVILPLMLAVGLLVLVPANLVYRAKAADYYSRAVKEAVYQKSDAEWEMERERPTSWDAVEIWIAMISFCSLFIGLVVYFPEVLVFTAGKRPVPVQS
jgi:hypothetical protein